MRPTNLGDGHHSDRFDEDVQLADPNPGGNWSPSPSQIREWGAVIKAENDERDGLTDEWRTQAVQEPFYRPDSLDIAD